MPFEWDSSNECSICLDMFDPILNDSIVIGHCLHRFHLECLKKYMLRKKNALREAEREVARGRGIRTPTRTELAEITEKIPCPTCGSLFSLNSLEPYESINVWPLNPDAPEPQLPKAPEDVNNILIYRTPGNTKSQQAMIDKYYRSGVEEDNKKFYENFRPRCPLPHFLPHIQIPEPTDSLEFIETQLKAALRNSNIALNDHINATDYIDYFFIDALHRQGIIMSDLDKLYNKKIYSITKYRYDETMRIYSIIQEIFEESKTFSGRIKLITRSVKKEPNKTFKSIGRSIAKTTNDRYQSFKKSLFETNLRENMRALGNKLRRRTMRHVRIEGGKNKPRKPKKHNKSRKLRKPRKK
jgi:hypothetical protein